MPEAQYAPYIVSVVMIALGIFAWHQWRSWQKTWESRILAQDRRLDRHGDRHNEHDVNHATLKSDLKHIKETSEETRADVKELLRINGNNRASRG